MGGIPYLEKDDDVRATWLINDTVKIEWRGERFGVPMAFKRMYYKLRDWGEERLYNMFFEEVNCHLKELTEKYFLGRSNYIVPPESFKPDLATLNEILTKQGLHHLMNAPEPTGVRPISSLIGGEYEKPWIFKDCANTECVRYIATHETDGTGGI